MELSDRKVEAMAPDHEDDLEWNNVHKTKTEWYKFFSGDPSLSPRYRPIWNQRRRRKIFEVFAYIRRISKVRGTRGSRDGTPLVLMEHLMISPKLDVDDVSYGFWVAMFYLVKPNLILFVTFSVWWYSIPEIAVRARTYKRRHEHQLRSPLVRCCPWRNRAPGRPRISAEIWKEQFHNFGVQIILSFFEILGWMDLVFVLIYH